MWYLAVRSKHAYYLQITSYNLVQKKEQYTDICKVLLPLFFYDID